MARSIAAIALSLAVIAACDSDDAETTSTSTNTTSTSSGGSVMTRWCEAIAAPYCEAVFACCDDPTALDQGWGGSVEACTSNLLDDCGQSELTMALPPSDTLLLDEQILGRCLELLAELESAGPACTRLPVSVVLSSCLYALEGPATLGETCSGPGYMLQCSEGGCLYNPALGEGTCVAFAALGAPCTMQPCDFRNEVGCLDDGTGMYTCQRLRDIGEACLLGFECFSGSCVSGTCAAPTPEQLCEDG